VACPFAQFDGNRFYDSEYVREYRKKLLDYVHSGKGGFGLRLHGDISDLKFETVANNIIVTYSIEKLQVETTISISEKHGVVQNTLMRSASTKEIDVGYTLALNISVNRASYGQLTEGGPIPIPSPRNEFRQFNGNQAWAIINKNLDAIIQGTLYCDHQPVRLETMKVPDGIPLGQPTCLEFHETLKIPPGQTRTLISTYRLRSGTDFWEIPPTLPNLKTHGKEGWKIRNESMSLIIKGNLSYILGNCTIPVTDNVTCLITDHVALPLGWNRDN
jgi:hypothetical protein